MKKSNPKVILITTGLFLFIAVIVLNVVYVSVTKKHLRTGTDILAFQQNKALSQIVEKAKRGTIFDRNGGAIALDIERYQLYIVLDNNIVDVATKKPLYVVDKEATAKVLNQHLGISVEEATSILSNQEAKQVEIGVYGKSITKEKKEALEKTGLPGFRFEQVRERAYPSGKFASNILGFARYNSEKKRIVGELGIEHYLDKYLTGEDGLKEYKIGKNGQVIPGQEKIIKTVKNGNDVYLTIDKNIQAVLETLVDENDKVERWAIVTNAKSGEILGVATSNGFDLNEKNITGFSNIVGDTPYEPGSVIKVFTYAAAMDNNTFTEGKKIQSGAYHIGLNEQGDVIRLQSSANAINTIYDAGRINNGIVDHREGIAKSLNTLTTDLVVSELKFKPFMEYFDKFRLYEDINIPGINSVAGTRNFKGPVEILNTAFGQGSSTTTLNIVQAFSAVVNNGVMTKPYIIDSVVNPVTKQKFFQHAVEKVELLKQSTSEKMRDYLKEPVERPYGTARHYKLADVNILGKTGTAEIVVDGKYSSEIFINSTILAAPAEEPEIILYYAQKAKTGTQINYEKVKTTLKVALDTIKVSTKKPQQNKNFKINYMPNLLNHSKKYAESKISDMDADIHWLGDGDTVISHYPEENEVITTNRKLFLFTGGLVRMPDMHGWTYKEVATFSRLSGFGVSIKGSGKVISQSIKPNVTIDENSDIIVELK